MNCASDRASFKVAGSTKEIEDGASNHSGNLGAETPELKVRRRHARRLIVTLGLVVSSMFSGFVMNASSASVSGPQFGQCWGGWYTQDVCKYDQSFVTLSGSTLDMYWRGATASGSCDPTNNITQWREEGNRVSRSGQVVNGYGGGSWKTNCDIPSGPTLSASGTWAGDVINIDFFFQYSHDGQTINSGLNGTWMVA